MPYATNKKYVGVSLKLTPALFIHTMIKRHFGESWPILCRVGCRTLTQSIIQSGEPGTVNWRLFTFSTLNLYNVSGQTTAFPHYL